MPRKLDLKQIRDIDSALKKLPPVQKFTVTEAVLKLAGTIRGLMEKGYDAKEIAEYLTNEGLPASARLIKKVLASVQEEAPDAVQLEEAAEDDQGGQLTADGRAKQ